MINLLIKIFKSPVIKILFKTVGSIASAILAISGYLLVLNYSVRSKQGDPETDQEEESVPREASQGPSEPPGSDS